MIPSMLMRKAVAAPLLLALLGLSAAVACQGAGDEEGTPSPTPTSGADVRQRLERFSTSALLPLAFPDVAFTEVPAEGTLATHVVQKEPTWRIETLGQLVGYFTRFDQIQLAALVYLRGPEDDQRVETHSRLLGLPEGLFVAFVELDSRGQPVLMGWSFLDASATQLLDVPTTLGGDVRPFRQGERDSGSGTFITPTVAVDADNDGLEEMVLLDAGTADGIGSARYLTFRWTGPGFSWQCLTPPEDREGPDSPTQAVLDYIAAVHAATSTAAHWDDLDRALVLGWLGGDDETVPDDLLEALAEEAPASAVASIRRELEATRELFRRAFDLWSADMQELQPWPDFINGFRTATGVALEEMSAPSQEEERTVVEVVVIASSREGPDLVDRRFRVTYELVEEEEGWRLDSADAQEEREPE